MGLELKRLLNALKTCGLVDASVSTVFDLWWLEYAGDGGWLHVILH
jgi:hypothetical protein